MLHWALVFLLVALVAGFLGFWGLEGLAMTIAKVLFVVFLAIRRLVVGPEAEGLFTLFAIAFFLIGVALFGLGLLGEYVGRIYEEVRRRPRYIIASILERSPGGP